MSKRITNKVRLVSSRRKGRRVRDKRFMISSSANGNGRLVEIPTWVVLNLALRKGSRVTYQVNGSGIDWNTMVLASEEEASKKRATKSEKILGKRKKK